MRRVCHDFVTDHELCQRTSVSSSPRNASGSSIASSGGLTPAAESLPSAISSAARAAGSEVDFALPPRVTVVPTTRDPFAAQLHLVHGDRLRRLDVRLGQLAVLEREQLLEQPRSETQPETRVSQARKARRQRRELGVERVDPGRASDGLRELALRRARERLDLGQLAVGHDHRAHLELVAQRLHRVRRGERMTGRRRVARGRPDLHRDGLGAEPPRRLRSREGSSCRAPSPSRGSRSGLRRRTRRRARAGASSRERARRGRRSEHPQQARRA